MDPLNLCLCPSCATFYRQFKNDNSTMNQLKDNISLLSKEDIKNSDPVVIELEDQELWFTQTHIAEIQALFALEKTINDDKPEIMTEKVEKVEKIEKAEKVEKAEPSLKPKVSENKPSVYSDFIGKRITRNWDGMVGIIREIEDGFFLVDVIEGPKEGESTSVQIEKLLDPKGGYLVE